MECKQTPYNLSLTQFTTYRFAQILELTPDFRVVLLNYREDGVTPYVVVWKHGIEEMKV